MDTAFLKSFALVGETGSMAEAARRQRLTPAAIAQQIKALETELDCRLVSRAGRTVQPTQAGHRLLQHAKSVLDQVNHIRQTVRDDLPSGELRLGTINSALHTMLPKLLGKLSINYPYARVFIQSGLSSNLVDAVHRRDLDAAICLHPDYLLPKTLMWKLLREEPLVVLAPRKYAKRNPHELLRSLPFIRYDRSLGGGRQADRYLLQHGIEPQEKFELSSLLAISMMVHEGLGVSLVPEISSPLTSSLNAVSIKVGDMNEPRRFGVIWQRTSPRSSLVNAFLEQTTTVKSTRAERT